MESMTNAPYLLPQARKGYRLGNSQIIDSVVNDGLWDIYNNYHMGMTGENVAQKYGVTREQQDELRRELAPEGRPGMEGMPLQRARSFCGAAGKKERRSAGLVRKG